LIGFYRFFEKGNVIVGVGTIGCIVDVARVCAKFSTNWSGAKTISPPHNQGRPAANAEVTADYVNDMPNRVKTDAQGRATLHVRNAGVNVVGAMLSANMPQDKVATLHRVVSTLSFTSSKK
jgi:hypothetical protein